MDCQKLIVYGILVLVGIYILKDVCGVKLPFIEGFDNSETIGSNSVSGGNGVAGPGAAAPLGAPATPSTGLPTVPTGNTAPVTEGGSPSDVKDGQWGAAEPGLNELVKKISLNLNYSYLVIAKTTMLNNKYTIIKETLLVDFKRIK